MTAYASYRSRRSTSMVKENNQRGAHQAVSFVSSREQIVVAYPSVTIGPTFLLCSHKDNTPIMYMHTTLAGTFQTKHTTVEWGTLFSTRPDVILAEHLSFDRTVIIGPALGPYLNWLH